MLHIGIIGYGYWGPNIVRNFQCCEGARVTHVCDIKSENLKKIKQLYPAIETETAYENIVKSKDIDAIAIITPVSTHFEIAKKSIENGKHILIEKPFTLSVEEAQTLIEMAEKKNVKIMVDHTFLFTSAVRKIKEFIEQDTLGDIYYYDSTRINLGLFQHDVNVIWDLAPHDFSIMDYIIDKRPVALSAHGIDHFGRGLENIAYVTVYFEDNLLAHFNFNWLSPVKLRTTLIGGEKKMLQWNDLEADEKIKIYDKGVNIKSVQNKEDIYKLLVSYRSGDIWSPKLEHTEALKLEMQYFVDCIKDDITPINDGISGLRIVSLLEACNTSLKDNGKVINL